MSQANLFSPTPRSALPVPDVCRNRHRGNPQSVAANRLVDPMKTSMRTTIYNLLAAGAGMTLKELGQKLGKQLNQISGRISELKADNKIYETGEVRNGCAVLKVAK